MCNIVIFGPTQVGKTTFAGYLALGYYNDEDFSQYARRIKNMITDLGIPFHKEMLLPSIISMDNDELKNYGNDNPNTKGTTKRIHRSRIVLPTNNPELFQSKCIFIDTPGTHARIAEKYRGIFEGDLGVYIININDMIYMAETLSQSKEKEEKYVKEFNKYTDPLRFWRVYKAGCPLIIVLSKIDTIGFDQGKIDSAVDEVNAILKKIGLEDIPVIPTGIVVSEETSSYKRIGYNILSSLDNYSCFMDALTQKVQSVEKHLSSGNTVGFAYIDSITQIKKDTRQRAFRIKVLEGMLKTNDTVNIGPVKYNKTPTFICGRVKSLKKEKLNVIDMLCEGQIGGVMLVPQMKLSINNRSENIDLNSIRKLKTTVLTTGSMRTGNCIELLIRRDELDLVEWQAIYNLYPKEEIEIFWLGQKMRIELVGRIINENEAHLFLMPLVSQVESSIVSFALPEKEKYDLDLTTVLQTALENERRYIHAQVVSLYNFKNTKLSIEISVLDDDITYLFEEKESMVQTEYNKEQGNTTIRISGLTLEEIIVPLKKIRKLFQNWLITDYEMKITPVDCDYSQQ